MENAVTLGYSHSVKRVYVKSYDLEDSASFRKIRPDPQVRFYHTFTRKLLEAASTYEIPLEKIREITAQVLKLIPLYSFQDYQTYMRSAVEDKIRQEGSGGYGKDLGKTIGQKTTFEAYDLVTIKNGLLYRNRINLNVDIKYDFQLV